VTEATIGRWFKKPGDAVAVDEPLVELETDKVTIEVPAPSAGTLGEISAKDGETVAVGALLGQINDGAAGAAAKPAAAPAKAAAPAAPPPPAAAAPAAAAQKAPPTDAPLAPSVRKISAGKRHRCRHRPRLGQGRPRDQGRHARRDREGGVGADTEPSARGCGGRCALPRPPTMPRGKKRVKMTRLRQTIARRLKEVQNTAAMLTTFNEVDMSHIMAMRTQYKDVFEKKHGSKLGFMGFFTKACVQALKDIPAANAEIDGTDLIYKNYYHIGVAVGTDRGLVVPVVRDCDQKSIAEIEKAIADSAGVRATASSRSTRCRAAPSPSPMAASMVR